MSMVLFTIATYFAYRISKKAYTKWSYPFLYPLVIAPIALIGLLSSFHVSANEYLHASKVLTYMLGPATVAFAIPVYKHFHLVKKYIGNILVSITCGTLIAIFSSFGLSELLHLKPDFILSILPRSITTPIAIEVSKEIGGLPTLTTVFVIMTGIIGGIIGPLVIKGLAIKTPIAKGLALGTAAHGSGTNKALEYGEQEATFSTLAMIFAAWITFFWGFSLIPALMNFVHLH
ncbi:LrgB family protein [Neobacillus ginsengisoli]|uniref:Murein hydrolase (TIGR00659 family) n=1 Tax=Neobacillus ginsengisoli TaxID=904295 RepID=A0ABT9XQK0_9BACI|nr:LrgB family protein [Neobacillus ginsengisoli]MDQ0197814.1 putative murein hydrolase (TIGR00659 family) [Neobacillus ginsengisoli]